MQRLEVSCAVGRVYTSLGAKRLKYKANIYFKFHITHDEVQYIAFLARNM